MRIIVIVLACFCLLPLSGQKKWEKLTGKFDRHYHRPDFEAALDDALDLLAYSRENHDSTGERYALSNFYAAKAYEALGDPEEAKPYIKIAHRLLTTGMAYNKQTGELVLLYGKIETQLGFHKSAANLLDNALEISLELYGQESLPYLQSLYAMADLEMARAQWDQMISLIVEALQIHERNAPLDQAYAVHANYLGLLFLNNEQLEEAKLYLNKSLMAYRPHGIKEDLTCANVHNNLGLIEYYQSEYDEAALHYKKAASIYRKLEKGYSENYLMLLSNRASLYLNRGKKSMQESSIRALDEYLDLYKDRTDLPYIQALENLAGFYEHSGNFKKAEAFYLRAEKARQSSDSN